MAKNITFESNGKDYRLEYSRTTVKRLYKLGFYPDLIAKDPIEAIELLAYGSFLKNHPNVKRSEAVAIVSNLQGSDDENEALTAMLMDMVSEAMNETIIKKTGNVQWQVNE